MANKRIDQLNPNNNPLTGVEMIPIFDVVNGTTERIGVNQLTTYILSGFTDTFTTGGTFILSALTIDFSTNNDVNYSVDLSELDSKYGVLAVTYSELQTLKSNSNMSSGVIYHITDRDIWIHALSSSVLSVEGIKSLFCPTEYGDAPVDGNQWQGVWPSMKVVAGTGDLALNDLCIWGGRVWKKITDDTVSGSIDGEFALDNVNWVLVDPTSFTNNEYTLLYFGVHYDFDGDQIVLQWDKKNNYFTNPTYLAFCDWNNPDIYNNRCGYIINNSYESTRYISDNVLLGSGGIYYNQNVHIQYNSIPDALANIHTNFSRSGIEGQIKWNTNSGSISNNDKVSQIIHNSNKGSITFCESTITSNSNTGYIRYATYAVRNSNLGNLTNVQNTLSGIYINNTTKSSSLSTELLGGQASVVKFVEDQVYLNNAGVDMVFFGEGSMIIIQSAGFTGALNLNLSIAWNNSKQGIKFLQIAATGPITINQISGLPYHSTLRFINVGAPVTFATNVSGNYLVGDIYNKLDSLGNPTDITLTELGDWVEYEYTAYPNIKPGAGTAQIPNSITVLETAYGVHREINHGLYPPINTEFPLTLMYKSGVRTATADSLAWIVIGAYTSDPPTIATISWTDTLSNPRVHDIVASDPAGYLISGTFTQSAADIAIDGQYTLYMETAGAQSFSYVFNV